MMEMAAQPLHPELVKSMTEDDDNSSTVGASDKALEYLLRYETMVRQQDSEDIATLAHIRPLLYRIEKLGGKQDKDAPENMEDIMSREVTFHQLQTALEVLETDASSHAMTTDRQLMLVLRTLARKDPETDDECISWAEFYQCYKTVVAGMQTLQYVPSQGLVRSRTKDRTLTLLSMFESPSTKLFNEDLVPRTIQTGEDEALEGDRHYIMPELRKQRRKAILLFTFLMAMAVLVFGVFFESPHINNGKPMIDIDGVLSQLNEAMQAAKSAVAPWLPEHMLVETKSSMPEEVHTPRESFFHHTVEDVPSNDSQAVDPSTTTEREGGDNVVAVLAGASGVAVAPLLVKAAALLQTGGLPGIGAITIFTVAIAPVIKSIDVVISRMLRSVGIGKKKKQMK